MIWMIGTMALAGTNFCDGGGPGDAGLITRNGNHNYATLGAALAASSDGDDIAVCAGTYFVTETLTKSVTLRAVDGPSLTRLENFWGSGADVLTIDDPGGMVSVDGFSVVGGADFEDGIEVETGSEAQLWNLEVFGHTDHGIHVHPDAAAVLHKTSVFANYEGGIAADGAGLVGLVDSRVWGNFGRDGAGLKLGDGRIVVGGLVESNQADRGGGIFASGAVVLLGTEVWDNHAKQDGGGIYVEAGSGKSGTSLSLLGCTVTDNDAISGGGIYAEPFDEKSEWFTSLDLEHTVISGNLAVDSGGGIWSGARSIVSEDTEISKNEAPKGGGLLVYDLHPGGATVEGLTIVGNEAASGGGIAVRAVVRSTVFTRTTVSENHAQNGGGIIVLRPSGFAVPGYSDIDLTDSTVRANTADYAGGGLLLLGDRSISLPSVRISGSAVEDNRAQSGGGVWADDGFITTSETSVRNNSASAGAGAMVTGPLGYLSSSGSDWSNAPDDVQTEAGNVYVYGTTDFSCDATTCVP